MTHPRTYETTAGDTWDIIARRALGSERYIPEMIGANPTHGYTVRFGGAVLLTVPPQPDRTQAIARPPWRQR